MTILIQRHEHALANLAHIVAIFAERHRVVAETSSVGTKTITSRRSSATAPCQKAEHQKLRQVDALRSVRHGITTPRE